MFPTFSVTGVNPLWSHIFGVINIHYCSQLFCWVPVGYPAFDPTPLMFYPLVIKQCDIWYGRPYRNINVRGCDRCHPHRLEFWSLETKVSDNLNIAGWTCGENFMGNPVCSEDCLFNHSMKKCCCWNVMKCCYYWSDFVKMVHSEIQGIQGIFH